MTESLTQLDSSRTSVSSTGYRSYREYRLQQVGGEGVAAENFFAQLHNPSGHSPLDLWMQCCTDAWFVRDEETKKVSIYSHRCGLRWCPVCSRSKGFRITRAVQDRLKGQEHVRILTLTTKHKQLKLSYQIDNLYKAFRNIRKRRAFQKYVFGGVWFFQITFNQKTETWHPHLHCLVVGRYIKWREVKDLWQKITGDSCVVDTRYAENQKKIIGYVSRYVSRPCSLESVPSSCYLDLAEAFRSRRLCGSWGKLRGVDLRGIKSVVERKIKKLGRWSTLMNLQKEDGRAALIVDAYFRNYEIPDYLECMDYDQWLDELPDLAGKYHDPGGGDLSTEQERQTELQFNEFIEKTNALPW